VLAGELAVEVEDDGAGLAEHKVSSPRSLGLIGMRERAEALHGRIQFHTRPGAGTVVSVRVPLEVPA
jgi:signal transduction histidine kinase